MDIEEEGKGKSRENSCFGPDNEPLKRCELGFLKNSKKIKKKIAAAVSRAHHSSWA